MSRAAFTAERTSVPSAKRPTLIISSGNETFVSMMDAIWKFVEENNQKQAIVDRHGRRLFRQGPLPHPLGKRETFVVVVESEKRPLPDVRWRVSWRLQIQHVPLFAAIINDGVMEFSRPQKRYAKQIATIVVAWSAEEQLRGASPPPDDDIPF